MLRGLIYVASAAGVAGCLSAPPGGSVSDDGGTAVIDAGSGDDGAVALPPPAHVMGNLLTLTFGDYDPSHGLRDRSGRAWHGDRGASDNVEGVYGQGIEINRSTEPFVLDSSDFFSTTLTVESWVQMKAAAATGRLFGDGNANLEYRLTVEDGWVAFVVNTGVQGETETVSCPELILPVGSWMHLALTWDGSEVVFYGNGELFCTAPLEVSPIEVANNVFMLGQAPAWIDELKVSDYVKTQSQIEESMAFNSEQIVDVCGDRFVLFGQGGCEPEDLCCTETCALETAGQTCSVSGEQQGTCDSDGLCTPDLSDGRVADSLVALYHFDSIDGGVVIDEGGLGEPANLAIKDTAAVEQLEGFLRIATATALIADTPAKIIEALTNSDAMTVEAWVSSATEPTGGRLPRRILSIAADNNSSNFTLGQTGSAYVVRLRGAAAQNDTGMPAIATGAGEATAGELDHVVVTFADDVLRLYVNGRLIESAPRTGIEEWNPNHHVVVGNEINATEPLTDREWFGDLHLIAIYHRALSPIDIARNYRVGP